MSNDGIFLFDSRRSGGPSRESTMNRYRGDPQGEDIQLVEAGEQHAIGTDTSWSPDPAMIYY